MAELEPGHPDELIETLRNLLREAQDPIGSLPTGTDPVEWAIRRFIDTWKTDARRAIEGVEESLNQAMALCDSQASLHQIKSEIDMARQTLQRTLNATTQLPCEVVHSAVMVTTLAGQKGTGRLVSDRHIVTNEHVVRGAVLVWVQFSDGNRADISKVDVGKG